MSNLNHSKKHLAQSDGVTGNKMEWGLRWSAKCGLKCSSRHFCLTGSRHGCLPASPKAFVHDFPVFYPCPLLPVHSCFSCCMSGGVAVQLCRYPWRHCNLSSQLLPAGGWVKAIANCGIKRAPTAAADHPLVRSATALSAYLKLELFNRRMVYKSKISFGLLYSAKLTRGWSFEEPRLNLTDNKCY